MKLALFSQEYKEVHKHNLEEVIGKRLVDVNILYINTAINYKPYKPDWYLVSENWYRSNFPKFREFDIERAYRADNNFNYREYFSKFDFIMFSGGNVFLLAYWLHKTEAGKGIVDLVNNDSIVYGGESAGACVLTHDITPYSSADDPNKAPEYTSKGLGLIDFAILPHWGLEGFVTQLEETYTLFENNSTEVVKLENDKGYFYNNRNIEIV